MSGIVGGVDYTVLFASNRASALDASNAMLTALYSGGSGAATPTNFVSTGNPITDLKLALSNQKVDIAQEAKQPQVQAAIAQFTKAVGKAATIQNALLNPYVQQVLLTANGLSSYIGQTALVQKLLLSDPADPKSLVKRLGNSAWLNTVQTYDFGKTGLKTLQNPKIQATLTGAYAEVKWRQSLDQATPGLSNALTFLDQASTIKSISDVLSSVTNFDVLTTALGIPPQIVNQSTTAVNSAINARLDFKKLQDPRYVTSLTDQYLLTMQSQKAASAGSGTDLTSLAVRLGGLFA